MYSMVTVFIFSVAGFVTLVYIQLNHGIEVRANHEVENNRVQQLHSCSNSTQDIN